MKKLKERFDTLSDAIIAIVMTILVLGITVPETSEEIPSFMYQIGLYFISFFLVANIWYRRTRLAHIEETNLKIVALDIIDHVLISLIPLMTRFVIDYHDLRTGVVWFGILIMLVERLLDVITVLSVSETKSKQFPEALRQQFATRMWKRIYATTALSIFFILLASLVPVVGMYFYFALPFFSFFKSFNIDVSRMQQFQKRRQVQQYRKYRRVKQKEKHV